MVDPGFEQATTFTILTIKLFYAKIKREPKKLGELET